MKGFPIVHIELSAQDPAASSKFYADVFGWKIERDPQFDYYQFAPQEGPGGGFVKPDAQMYKPGDIIPYIGTDDIDGMLKKIESAGGKTLVPKTDIGDFGAFAFFADPAGNRIGLYFSKRQ